MAECAVAWTGDAEIGASLPWRLRLDYRRVGNSRSGPSAGGVARAHGPSRGRSGRKPELWVGDLGCLVIRRALAAGDDCLFVLLQLTANGVGARAEGILLRSGEHTWM